jgi:hypothetical protein
MTKYRTESKSTAMKITAAKWEKYSNIISGLESDLDWYSVKDVDEEGNEYKRAPEPEDGYEYIQYQAIKALIEELSF